MTVDREHAADALRGIVGEYEDRVRRHVAAAIPRLLPLLDAANTSLIADGILVDGSHVETLRLAARQRDWTAVHDVLRSIAADRAAARRRMQKRLPQREA